MVGDIEVLQRFINDDPASIKRLHEEYGRTALEQALMVGQRESAELLVKHGAEVQPSAAAAMGRVDEITELLQTDGDATKRQFGNSHTLLIWAIRGGQIEVVKLLLDAGAVLTASI